MEGIKDAEQGKVISTDELLKRMDSWANNLDRATTKLETFPKAGRMVPEFEQTSLNLREVIYQVIVSFTG